MRKDTSAALKAGAIAGLPFGVEIFALYVALSLRDWYIVSDVARSVHMSPTQLFGFMAATLLAVDLVLGAFLGAISGVIFLKTVNKLPICSTHVKAAIPFAIVWMIVLIRLYPVSMTGYLKVSLPVLALFLFDAVIFSWLLDKWTDDADPRDDVA